MDSSPSHSNTHVHFKSARNVWKCDRIACAHTHRAQSDKIFQQQGSMAAANEELRQLRTQLEGRGAQQALIEAEIARQMDDYGRLKEQLVRQEELQVGEWLRLLAAAVLFAAVCATINNWIARSTTVSLLGEEL